MSFKDLNLINKHMIKELKKKGVKIVKIYSCPHHWEEKCKCRKPKPFMINKSIKEFNLEIKKTIFIGDDIRDWETAKNAKCKYLHMKKSLNIKDKLFLGDISDTSKAIKIIEETYD